MSKYELYVRVLTELSYRRGGTVQCARAELQDVLCELREMAAQECGDLSGEETQNCAESETTLIWEQRERLGVV